MSFGVIGEKEKVELIRMKKSKGEFDADHESTASGNSGMEISRAVLGVARREATQRTPTIGSLCEEDSRHDAETRQVGSRPTRETADLTMKIDPLRLRQSHLDTTKDSVCH